MKQIPRKKTNSYPRIICQSDSCAIKDCLHNFDNNCFNQIPIVLDPVESKCYSFQDEKEQVN